MIGNVRLWKTVLRADLDALLPGSDPDPSYHQAKIVRKTLIPTVLWLLYDFLSLGNDVNVASKVTRRKTLNFFLSSWRSLTKIAGSGAGSEFDSQSYGSAVPDPYHNVTDPQNWWKEHWKKTHAHGPFDRIFSKWASFYSSLSEFSARFVIGRGLPLLDKGSVGVTPIKNTNSMTADFFK